MREAADHVDLGPAPRDDPVVYPGAIPATSFLFTGTAIEAIDDTVAGGHPIVGGGSLDDRLEQLAAAPMARRHAVLAYGSNRSPAQLRSKFTAVAGDHVIPVLRASVADVSVVFAGYLAGYGSVPATLIVDPGSVTEVSVVYLDDQQAAVVDATEPGGHRPDFDAEAHELRLRSGRSVDRCSCYWSSRVVLTRDGEAVRLREISATGGALGSSSQIEMQTDLLAVWADRVGRFGDVGAFLAAFRRDAELRANVNAVMADLIGGPVGRIGATRC